MPTKPPKPRNGVYCDIQGKAPERTAKIMCRSCFARGPRAPLSLERRPAVQVEWLASPTCKGREWTRKGTRTDGRSGPRPRHNRPFQEFHPTMGFSRCVEGRVSWSRCAECRANGPKRGLYAARDLGWERAHRCGVADDGAPIQRPAISTLTVVGRGLVSVCHGCRAEFDIAEAESHRCPLDT